MHFKFLEMVFYSEILIQDCLNRLANILSSYTVCACFLSIPVSFFFKKNLVWNLVVIFTSYNIHSYVLDATLGYAD